MKRILSTCALAVLTATACGDDGPTEPNLERSDVAGVYAITALTFDPQGSLAPVDLLAELGEGVPPRLTLTADGTVQLLAQDPITDLAVTIPGTFRTTSSGATITFSGDRQQLLLPPTLTMVLTGDRLSYSAALSGGVSRARLVALFPEFEGEQLLDPVPGQLTFTAER